MLIVAFHNMKMMLFCDEFTSSFVFKVTALWWI